MIARRLFASRRAQPWPPTVIVFSKWGTIYVEAADGLGVLPTVEQAAAWANVLIADLDAATPSDNDDDPRGDGAPSGGATAT